MSSSLTNNKEIVINQKLKAFIAEKEGCELTSILEEQYQCSITISNDVLIISPKYPHSPLDAGNVLKRLKDNWQKHDIQLTIRIAALNASCTHICEAILPRAYSAVVILFSCDIRRLSKCNDIIVEHSEGKVSVFGTESSVSAARLIIIERLTEHFGQLEIEIPQARRVTRLSYSASTPSFCNSRSAEIASSESFEDMFSLGERNAILSPISPFHSRASYDESILSSNFSHHLLFTPPKVSTEVSNMFDASPIGQNLPLPIAPPHSQIPPPVSTRANNVEKIRFWISKESVGKILGNRAMVKKQVEGQFNCVITVRTEFLPHFGMISVEVMGQNETQCKNARDAIFNITNTASKTSSPVKNDSGFSSPSNSNDGKTTPEKKFTRRSNFRDQPKVLLALTPRKSPPME